MVANILLFNPKGMAAKGAGAPAERSDRLRRMCHHSLRGEVERPIWVDTRTTIGVYNKLDYEDKRSTRDYKRG